ncbi:MAG: Slp family lipoprotein [Rhodanobacter sp.]|jgi:outer membrane lipoprotein|nr:Slp family lipoprotein [Rhodanobacter sp.]
MSKPFAIILLAAGLTSCATVPAPLQGQFAPVTPRDTASAGATGQPVRWGGEIIKVDPKKDATCFEILGRKLDDTARPRLRTPSDGRFIACHMGFYDPEEFARGRELTIVGRITGTEQGKVGDFDYTYPRVAADTIYLWPKRLPVQPYYYDPWFYGPGPYWGYGPYWGPYWGWGGGWGGGGVVVIQHGGGGR